MYSAGNTKFWVGGSGAEQQDTGVGGASESATSWGGSGGVRFGSPMFSVTASGYYGKGIGTTLMFLNGAAGTRRRAAAMTCGSPWAGSARSPLPRPTAR